MELSYRERIVAIDLSTLEEKSKREIMITVCKILNIFDELDIEQCFKIRNDSCTRGYSWKLSKNQFRKDRKECFFS